MKETEKVKIPNWKVDLTFASAILLFAVWVKLWIDFFNLILT